MNSSCITFISSPVLQKVESLSLVEQFKADKYGDDFSSWLDVKTAILYLLQLLLCSRSDFHLKAICESSPFAERR